MQAHHSIASGNRDGGGGGGMAGYADLSIVDRSKRITLAG